MLQPLLDKEIEIVLFREENSVPFSDWLDRVRDRQAAGVVRARLNRIRLGAFGDCKSVGGGVEEVRIDFGPGYRVYFGRDGARLVVLLCGGSKGTQDKDIRRAQKYWREYKNAKLQDRD